MNKITKAQLITSKLTSEIKAKEEAAAEITIEVIKDKEGMLKYYDDIRILDDYIYEEEMRNIAPLESADDGKRPSKATDLKLMFNRNAIHFLAVRDGKAIGAVVIRDSSYKNCPTISSVGVIPEAQKEGVATMLLEYMFEYVKDNMHNVKHIVLGVVVSNTNAMNIYKKQGFKPMSTIMYSKL